MLLDSGSSHSYINKDIVECLHCNLRDIPAKWVKVANGGTEMCEAEVPNFQWWVQGEI